MKKTILFVASVMFTISSHALDNTYHYSINLTTVSERKMEVTLIPPQMKENKVVFAMPKMVPGTYSIYDFGRFIDDFKAYDHEGNELQVVHLDVNSWEVNEALNLARITYRAHDTYHADPKDNPIFEPAGTDLQKDTCYVLNLHTFLGYFRGYLKQPYELNVTHRDNFYGSTSLLDIDNSATTDRFSISNYNEAVDNPIMYTVPDTAHIKVGTSDILISIFSPSHKADAKTLASQLDTLLQDQGKYLGGKLPVQKYSFLIYLAKREGLTGGFGALEHSYGSMYYLIDGTNGMLAPTVRDVASHEFFHIVTPLNIHSVEIADFDFDHPKMSEHLWLYEGSTEYHAHKVQVNYGLISQDQYLRVIKAKATDAMFSFNDSLSFTEMSKGCLDTFKDQYNNVYSKGMLISLCLDLRLLQLSGGKYNIMNLIHDLEKTYGKDRAFRDEELFPTIVSLTFPEIKQFLNDYVRGGKPLPLEEYLAYAGVEYDRVKYSKAFSMGQTDLGYNPETKRMIVNSIKNVNDFGKEMGYQVGDEIIKFNGKKVKPIAFREMREKWLEKVHEGDWLKITVMRKDLDGKSIKTVLKARVFKSDAKTFNTLKFMTNPSVDQLSIRKSWLEVAK